MYVDYAKHRLIMLHAQDAYRDVDQPDWLTEWNLTAMYIAIVHKHLLRSRIKV